MVNPDVILYCALLALPAVYLVQKLLAAQPDSADRDPPSDAPAENEAKPQTSIMQPARTDLAPPKDDPFTLAQLRAFDGTDASKLIYVAIKGTVFDVSHKADTYGPGGSYHIFAGKDASKGLGKSSLKEEDAVPDYSDLPENEMKVLADWHAFFSKRYNIVGRVVDLPAAVANL